MHGYNGKALTISLHSGNSTFVPSGWFMHAWSRIEHVEHTERSKTYIVSQSIQELLTH